MDYLLNGSVYLPSEQVVPDSEFGSRVNKIIKKCTDTFSHFFKLKRTVLRDFRPLIFSCNNTA
jgi:hypothetical protein